MSQQTEHGRLQAQPLIRAAGSTNVLLPRAPTRLRSGTPIPCVPPVTGRDKYDGYQGFPPSEGGAPVPCWSSSPALRWSVNSEPAHGTDEQSRDTSDLVIAFY